MQLNHAAGPDAGVSGIRNQHGVGRQEVGQFLAQPLGSNGNGVRVERVLVFVPPVLHMLLRPRHPACVAAGGFQHVDESFQRALGVAQQPVGSLVRPAQFAGVDVNLDGWRTLGGYAPIQRNLAAGVTADEQDQVGLGNHAIGGPTRITAHHAHGKRVILWDAALGVERCRHRYVQHFGQTRHLA